MDKTDRISFSKSFDLAGQNKLLTDPGHVYIAKRSTSVECLVDFFDLGRIFFLILGYSGDHLGMIRACSGGFSGFF